MPEERRFSDFPDHHPDTGPDSDTAGRPSHLDSPEKIVKDLFQTEKELAAETLRLVRARYDREKGQWEKIHELKERELLTLKKQLTETEERLRHIQSRFQDERQEQLQQLHVSAQGLKEQQQEEKHKWDRIADQVRDFRESASTAQAKLQAEQERVNQFRRAYAEKERALKDQLQSREEELLELKEEMLKKEEASLRDQARREEEINLLQEQTSALQKTLSDERQYQGKLVDKKDGDLSRFQKAIQDTVIQINLQRQKKEELEERIARQQQHIQELEDEQKRVRQLSEQERLEWRKTWQEEQQNWEKYKQETIAREETLKKETDDQVRRILQSVHIIEQQLADEQKARREAEQRILHKEQEIERLTVQKEELAAEWQKVLAAEQSSWHRRQEELIAEFEKMRHGREEESAQLLQELHNLQAALAEEKKLYTLERDSSREQLQRIAALEEEQKNLQAISELKEKEWQEVLHREQELMQKQLEEAKTQSTAQLGSREAEITRLNEDVRLLNGQILELRQKFSIEKNENSTRLERMQDFETQLAIAREQHDRERDEWQQKLNYAQELWDKQRQGLVQYQTELELQYQKELEVYKAKHRELVAQIAELQKQFEDAQNRISHFDAEKSGILSQSQREKQEYDQKIGEYKKKLQDSRIITEKEFEARLHHEQDLVAEKEQEVAKLRLEMTRLRQMAARESTSRQTFEQTNAQLTEKVKELTAQAAATQEELARERAGTERTVQERLASLEQSHAARLRAEEEARQQTVLESRDAVEKLNQYIIELKGKLQEEQHRMELFLSDARQQQDWKAKYLELQDSTAKRGGEEEKHREEREEQFRQELAHLQKRIDSLQELRDREHGDLEKAYELLRVLEIEKSELMELLRTEKESREREVQVLQQQLAQLKKKAKREAGDGWLES